MKVALNQKSQDGPWGGGNRFLSAITAGLAARGHQVTYDLNGPVDVILMTETRPRSQNVTFGPGAILRYLLRYPHTPVVHRINECDERKGERFITARLLRANYAADYTVFVGSWLMDLPAWRGRDRRSFSVILNGADTDVFGADGYRRWDQTGPLRLVTHHWGYHRFKGFDVYEKIDALLDNPEFATQFAMTYIGRLPDGYRFRNIKTMAPLDGLALAHEIKKSHVYVTGSVNEPGGNHQNEGALCGLPLIYRRSGCMPEYCDGFGVSYDGPDDVAAALQDMRKNYIVHADKITAYPHTATRMVSEWTNYLENIVASHARNVQPRSILRSPYLFLANQVPL